jgi:hypothetical protein
MTRKKMKEEAKKILVAWSGWFFAFEVNSGAYLLGRGCERLTVGMVRVEVMERGASRNPEIWGYGSPVQINHSC